MLHLSYQAHHQIKVFYHDSCTQGRKCDFTVGRDANEGSVYFVKGVFY